MNPVIHSTHTARQFIMAKILYQGHGSLRLESAGGIVVYIDPYAGAGYEDPADIILVTHQHMDHNCIEKPARKPDCIVIQNSDALKKCAYKSFTVKGLTIEAVPAYNKNHSKNTCVGYLVTVDQKLIYFAGDTSRITEMSDLAHRKIDYAFFPADGIYNMDELEASACAQIVGARHSTPIHMLPGRLFSEEKAAAFHADGKMIIRPAEEVTLD